MPKRTVFTNITPLPSHVSREMAIAMLHNHSQMIELNPLVIEHHPIQAPRNAAADEFVNCKWEELTDRINYLPGGMAKGKVSYKACFHDLPNGLQTHVYAPMGLDIREKWTICGSLPGEPLEPVELGLKTPRHGLYLREDGDMKCNALFTSFVRKNLDNSHRVLVERMLRKAYQIKRRKQPFNFSVDSTVPRSSERFQTRPHVANPQLARLPDTLPKQQSLQILPIKRDLVCGSREYSPAAHDAYISSSFSNPIKQSNLPELLSHQSLSSQQTAFYETDIAKSYRISHDHIAELEGSSTYDIEPSLDESLWSYSSEEDTLRTLKTGPELPIFIWGYDLEYEKEAVDVESHECMSATSDRSYHAGGENRFSVLSGVSSLHAPQLAPKGLSHIEFNRLSAVSNISDSR